MMTGFILNSWFLVIITFVYIVIYTLIMLIVEEKDLVRRFGDDYRKYQQETGALLPRIIWKKEK